MPEYPYRCLACQHTFSDIIPMKEYKTRRKCPESKKYKLERVLGNVTGFVKGEATTLGQLAEQNTKKMGNYELEKKQRNDSKELRKAKKEARKSQREINKMTPEQKKKYILEGD